MNFDNFAMYCLLGAGGAGALEILKLYENRGKLHLKKFQQQLRSPLHWAVVAGMLIASGFITWAFFANVDADLMNPWQLVATGAAARSVIRGAAAAQLANSSTKLGDGDKDSLTLRDLFL